MNLCNVVLSTEPRGGKGGVATVIPMYLEALGKLGRTDFIPTHNGRGLWGKFGPWIFSFFRSVGTIVRERRSKIVFHLHPGSGFCIIRMLFLALFLRCMLRQHVIVYLHTPYLEEYLNNRWWKLVLDALKRCADRLVVLTSYAFGLLRDRNLSSTARVVPNPFKSCYSHAHKHRLQIDNKIVLVMARLVEGKGVLETLRAMRELPDRYRLVIAGDGKLHAQIRSEIVELGLEQRVEMKGWVFGGEKEKLLGSASVFCLPSRVDSFGMSFIEAQAYDLPIVAFKHPPVTEVLRPEAAVVVESVEPAVVAEAIQQANSLNSIIEPGSGHEWVTTTFGVDSISLRLKNLIDEIA